MQPTANDRDFNHKEESSNSVSNPNCHSINRLNISELINTKIFNSEIIVNPIIRQYILLGYAAKGAIYFLIGILAIEAAILPEQKAAGTYSALKHLSGQPLGSILLCLLAITLTGYVWRRLLQAIIYPGHTSSFTPQALFQRLGYIISSLSYASIVYSALNIVFGLGKYNRTIKHLVGDLLDKPLGFWLVLLGGIGVLCVGFSYLYGAYTGSYICDFTLSNHKLKSSVKIIGKIGVATRGIAFIITGICLIQASILSNADLAGGLQNAFHVLEQQPLGWLWLVLIGCGFVSYGLYMFVAAKYRNYAIR